MPTMRDRLHRHLLGGKHRDKLLYLFVANGLLAFIWGPVFITLTIAGPARHLSSQVVWVALISYYANMMGNLATAAAIYSSLVAHRAAAQASENREAIDGIEHRA